MPIRYPKIGKRIQVARECMGMKQSELASHMKMSQAFISRLEANKTTTGLFELGKIAPLISVSLTWLTDGVTSTEIESHIEAIYQFRFGANKFIDCTFTQTGNGIQL